jgi:hypothetical protein
MIHITLTKLNNLQGSIIRAISMPVKLMFRNLNIYNKLQIETTKENTNMLLRCRKARQKAMQICIKNQQVIKAYNSFSIPE